MRSSVYSFLHVFGRIRYKKLFQQPLPDDASGRHWRRACLASPHRSIFHPLITLARFHIFACRTPAQAVNHSAATASAGLDMSRSSSRGGVGRPPALSFWSTIPQADSGLRRRCSNFCIPGRIAVGVASVFTNAGAPQCLAAHTLPRGVERGRTKST